MKSQKPGKERAPYPSQSSPFSAGKKATLDVFLRMSCVQLFSCSSTTKAGADGRRVGGERIAEIPAGTKAESLLTARAANAHGHGFAHF